MTQHERERHWAQLLGAGLDGDGDAYRAFLEDLAPSLRATARRGCARAGLGSGDVEDIVQETLLAVHLKRHTWRRAEPLGPWVTAITRHKLADALRRRVRRAEVALDDLGDAADGAGAADAAAAAWDLDRLMAALNPRQRAVVKAVSIEGWSAREAGARLAMSEGAVRVTLHRALKALAALCRGRAGREEGVDADD